LSAMFRRDQARALGTAGSSGRSSWRPRLRPAPLPLSSSISSSTSSTASRSPFRRADLDGRLLDFLDDHGLGVDRAGRRARRRHRRRGPPRTARASPTMAADGRACGGGRLVLEPAVADAFAARRGSRRGLAPGASLAPVRRFVGQRVSPLARGVLEHPVDVGLDRVRAVEHRLRRVLGGLHANRARRGRPSRASRGSARRRRP